MKFRKYAGLLGALLALSPATAKDLRSDVLVDPGSFRETDQTMRKSGVTVSAAQLIPIRVGSNKASVYTLIGPPHFREIRERSWDYIIFLVTGPEDPIRCRLRISFENKNGDTKIDHLTWNSRECALGANG
ncbi:MAG: outer membrane protein assembly factor BamE [Sphingomonadaceae bacterium]